jgi:uncharacterized protein YjiS (DUF1127 family)
MTPTIRPVHDPINAGWLTFGESLAAAFAPARPRPPRGASLWSRLRDLMAAMRRRGVARREIANASNRHLRDAGLSRSGVPLSADVATMLSVRANGRRGR